MVAGRCDVDEEDKKYMENYINAWRNCGMENHKGVINILTNPSFPDYVKIGYADDIDKRLKQLNRSECIPFAFRVYATYEVNSRLSDLKLHAIIDKLNPELRSIDDFNGQKNRERNIL